MLLQGFWVILDWTLLPFRKHCPCGLRSWCLPNVRILVTRQLIRSCLIRTEQTKTIPVGATAKMAQLRTAPPTWLWQRGLGPCAPGHFGLLHKKPERFHIQTIMWLEVPLPHTNYYVTWSSAVPLSLMKYSLAWSSASAQGIYWDLKFRMFRFRIQNSVWLGALKWRNSASAQGKYCGLEVTQFRFHTINLVRLEVSQFRFHTRALTLSPAVLPPHKEYPVTWSSAVSLPHKEYTMSRSSAVLLSHTEQSVIWSSSV